MCVPNFNFFTLKKFVSYKVDKQGLTGALQFNILKPLWFKTKFHVTDFLLC